MPTQAIQLEHLLELRDELRQAGFDPGLQRAIAGHNLLLALAVSGRLPANPDDWRTWLAPVFCSTAGEQEEFYRRYKGWVERHSALAVQAKEAAAAQASTTDALPAHVRSSAFRRLLLRLKPDRLKAELRMWVRWFARPKVWGTALAVLVLLAGLSWVWLRRQTTETLRGRVFSETESQPLEKASVQLANQTIETKADGSFEISYPVRNLDRVQHDWLKLVFPLEQLTVSHAEHFERNLIIFSYHLNELKIILAKRRGLETASTGTPVNPPAPPPQFSNVPKLKAWQIALILTPLLLYAIWLVWTWLRRRALLQRLPDKKLPQLHDLKVEGIEHKLFASPRVRRLLLGLRRPRPLPVRELDAPATVRATIRQGGVFTPAYGARRSSPEYLLLIDRTSAHDEQANVADELRKRLTENGVFVEPYYFQGDARSCRSALRDESAVSLQQLAGRFPDHRLLVFGDGAGFFDAFTGRPQRWLEQFTPWERRVLLTPETPARWGYRERELSKREFLLLPASAEGLEELSEWLSYDIAPLPRKDGAQPFPEMIEERPQRWLERHAPPSDETEELTAQVRAYLGQDGWDWLCACAVYPEVTWELTLIHGYWLFGGDEQWRETWAERVLRLVRLPWFRYGTMPDWWREHLLDSLQRGQKETVVRDGIERLLRSALDHPDEPITLEYAEPADRSFRARLRAWWQRQRLFWGLQTVEPEEPLRDYVFLRFLAGQRPNRLSVRVPEVLRRLLYKDGQSALGFHPVTMFVLATAASLAFFLFFYVRPRLDLKEPTTPSASPMTIPTVPPDVSITPLPVTVPSPMVTPAPTPVTGPSGPKDAPLVIDPKAQLKVSESQDGYVVELGNNITLDLVALPGGEFMMGSDKITNEEQPRHRVHVAPFNIGRTEVRQAQWQAVLGGLSKADFTQAQQQSPVGNNPSNFKGADLPVDSVTWDEAVRFCQRLTQLTGVQFRLPTEAEWEYAARGGRATEYSFGDNPKQLGLYAWYGDNSNNQTHPAGKKRANPFGLFDMYGNVWEWCQDVWHDNYQGAPTDGSAWLSGGDSSLRVVRGGSWDLNANDCRSALRVRVGPGLRDYVIGFRVVVSARTRNP